MPLVPFISIHDKCEIINRFLKKKIKKYWFRRIRKTYAAEATGHRFNFLLAKYHPMGYTGSTLNGSDLMAKLRSKINRFFYQHRDQGVRNLMLWLAIGNLIVWVLYLVQPSNPLFYNLLCFNPEKILSGEVWRLVTYPLVYLCESGSVLGILTLFFFYWCGMVLEQYWGTFRFNTFYLSGVLLTDLAGLIIALAARAEGGFALLLSQVLGVGFIGYVNFSLLLAAATVLPEEQVRIWFVLPVKMKWLAWFDLGFTLFEIVRGLIFILQFGLGSVSMYLLLLVPLVAVGNWLLFFGKQAANILPDFLRYHPTRKSWKRKVKQGRIYEVPNKQGNARFRCTVCGRTELTNPGLEFRYCSKCAGYRCYCADHIQNHVHITE